MKKRADTAVKRTAGAAAGPASTPLRFSLWLFFGFLILVLDQGTKFYFNQGLDPGDVWPVARLGDAGIQFVLAHNRGAAFSFLADAGGWQRWLFSGLALAVIVVGLRMLWRHNHQRLFSFSVVLLLAGALGNLIDRVSLGYVIDFIDCFWGRWHWPAFNVADIAICAGCFALVMDELLGVSRGR